MYCIFVIIFIIFNMLFESINVGIIINIYYTWLSISVENKEQPKYLLSGPKSRTYVSKEDLPASIWLLKSRFQFSTIFWNKCS